MKIAIEHSKTKRQIDGIFGFCCSREDLQELRDIINDKLDDEGFTYGWVYVDEYISVPNEDYDVIKRQKQIPNTEPKEWDK